MLAFVFGLLTVLLVYILAVTVRGHEPILVLIARALAQEPRLLIMDEPTASLDFGNQVRVLQHVKSLARQGMGIVMSTHAPDHALACADRVALLHEGRLVKLGPPTEVIIADSLRLIYGVDVEVVKLTALERRVCVPRFITEADG